MQSILFLSFAFFMFYMGMQANMHYSAIQNPECIGLQLFKLASESKNGKIGE